MWRSSPACINQSTAHCACLASTELDAASQTPGDGGARDTCKVRLAVFRYSAALRCSSVAAGSARRLVAPRAFCQDRPTAYRVLKTDLYKTLASNLQASQAPSANIPAPLVREQGRSVAFLKGFVQPVLLSVLAGSRRRSLQPGTVLSWPKLWISDRKLLLEVVKCP